ncbi:hypothetical protein PoMZ_09911 [Pyricularia oryzae]|uniref:Uncharacterized protein n=1 Tax=Pyricularia oryzae TaxID=318829 RepID=A0A4P7N0Z6_PYROR|nr:hypothetical protein PoMZ_09911 [Pyricularia oryzae]
MRRLLNWKLGLDASDWPGATPSGKCQGLAAGVNCSMIGPETLQGPNPVASWMVVAECLPPYVVAHSKMIGSTAPKN